MQFFLIKKENHSNFLSKVRNSWAQVLGRSGDCPPTKHPVPTSRRWSWGPGWAGQGRPAWAHSWSPCCPPPAASWMLCSHPQTPAIAGRPQGGAWSQLQRQEEGVVVLRRGRPARDLAIHSTGSHLGLGRLSVRAAWSSSSITWELRCPHRLWRAHRTGTLWEFPEVTRTPQRSQSVLCLPEPSHSIQSVNLSHRQRDNHSLTGPLDSRVGEGHTVWVYQHLMDGWWMKKWILHRITFNKKVRGGWRK